MKNSVLLLTTVMIFLFIFTACGAGTAPATTGGSFEAEAGSGTVAEDRAPASGAVLSTDYADALPVDTQLAFGTMRLEGTDLAVTPEQAGELLDYWRVLQTLAQSDSTAAVELNAVIKQIQAVMSGEQIAAIAGMQLTEEKVQTMLEEGALGFGRVAGRSTEGAAAGGGFRGGGPGGGLLGGPPGGGPDDGPGGLGGDPSAFETRQAEIEASGENPASAFIERASSGMVIRLLEQKTGQAPERGFGAAFDVVGELTGLSQEEIGDALRNGQTLGQLLEENGVFAEEAKQALLDAMADVQVPGDQELDTWVDGLLTGSLRQGGQANGG